MRNNKDKAAKPKKNKKMVSGGNIAKMLLTIFALGGVAGGVYALVNSSKVPVCTVASAGSSIDVVFASYADYLYYTGELESGSMEDVKLNSDLSIKQVNAKKGDTVNKGDLLIEYDVHELEDAAEDAKLLVKTLTNNMEVLANEIYILERLQPSENKPAEQEETPEEEPTPDTDSDTAETEDTPLIMLPDKITKDSVPLTGSGTLEDPYVFYASKTAVVTKEFLTLMAQEEEPVYTEFYVCNEIAEPLFARVIDSSKIDKSSVEDFILSEGVTVSPTGSISFSGKSSEFASFTMEVLSAAGVPGSPEDTGALPEGFEMPENFEIPEEYANASQTAAQNEAAANTSEPSSDISDTGNTVSSGLTGNEHYVYSLKELREMIKERQEQRAELDLQKRQAELAAKNAERLAKTGGEVAPISGEVTFCAKDRFHLSPNDAYLTITNSEGMTLTSHIGEYARESLEVGKSVLVRCYPAEPSDGTITYIGDTPMALDQVSYSDSFESQYEFRVVLNKDMDVGADSVFDIEIHPEESGDNAIKIPSAFVRREAGKAYVMMDDGSGVLQKRYVKLGKAGLETSEIVEGLTSTDKIAIPYGKAVEGAKTKETDYNTVAYGGLF